MACEVALIFCFFSSAFARRAYALVQLVPLKFRPVNSAMISGCRNPAHLAQIMLLQFCSSMEIDRVGQNRIPAPCMTVCMVIFLLKIPCTVYTMYTVYTYKCMVLANPRNRPYWFLTLSSFCPSASASQPPYGPQCPWQYDAVCYSARRFGKEGNKSSSNQGCCKHCCAILH